MQHRVPDITPDNRSLVTTAMNPHRKCRGSIQVAFLLAGSEFLRNDAYHLDHYAPTPIHVHEPALSTVYQ